MPTLEERRTGCFWGLVTGDALGAPVEFAFRDRFPEIRNMTEGGKFSLPAGGWTDDTAMMLCLAQSLTSNPMLDTRDLLSRFIGWAYNNENTSTGRAIGCGQNTLQSLIQFHRKGLLVAEVRGRRSDGNGSLMRLAPVPIVHFQNPLRAMELAEKQSRCTHASTFSADACILMTHLLCQIFAGQSLVEACDIAQQTLRTLTPEVYDLTQGHWQQKTRAEIQSDGFVLHTLEAALWAISQTTTFEDALILAVNLGHDADTVGAVTGQLAGALYGLSSIPERWRSVLAKPDLLAHTCQALLRVQP